MKARARCLLAALEDGCETRAEIFAHQGRFSLLNNAAAELRAAGIPVVCSLEDDGEYHYRLADDGVLSEPPVRAASTFPVDPQAAANTVGGSLNASVTGEPGGQMTLAAA